MNKSTPDSQPPETPVEAALDAVRDGRPVEDPRAARAAQWLERFGRDPVEPPPADLVERTLARV
ncbi:MAG: hypothetical protein R3336_03910, partial [Phycisphaeraceae bacterium]|nr:hypothetical protein [Phycisphaeraceae bacterium]